MGSSGIFHRPLVRSCKPVMMTWFCLNFVYVKLGEDSDAVVTKKLFHGDERACGEVFEDVGGFRFGRDFGRHFQGGLYIWFDDVAVGHLDFRAVHGAHDVGAVW